MSGSGDAQVKKPKKPVDVKPLSMSMLMNKYDTAVSLGEPEDFGFCALLSVPKKSTWGFTSKWDERYFSCLEQTVTIWKSKNDYDQRDTASKQLVILVSSVAVEDWNGSAVLSALQMKMTKCIS